jgi:hypothetical protein
MQFTIPHWGDPVAELDVSPHLHPRDWKRTHGVHLLALMTMGKSSSQRRAEKGDRCINVYPPDTSLGWRVIRQVTPAKAAENLAAGRWREVYDEHGNFWGCQLLLSFKTDQDMQSGASSPSITVSECELNAGLRGSSHTAGLPEEKRISRHSQTGKALPPEDAIERAIEKVKQWPWPASRIDDGTGIAVFGDRAVRVYPKSA